MLEEPRRWHPWDKGVNYVISECQSLNLLNKGHQIGSKGLLDLTKGVSVIDSRPFLSKGAYPALEEDEWEKLYDLVLVAIQAKKPDVLLCMGAVATNVVEARKHKLSPEFWLHTQMISSMHPGKSINYNSADIQMCKELFRPICNAYESLDGRWDDVSWEQRFINGQLSVPQTVLASGIARPSDIKCMRMFLEVYSQVMFSTKILLAFIKHQPRRCL